MKRALSWCPACVVTIVLALMVQMAVAGQHERRQRFRRGHKAHHGRVTTGHQVSKQHHRHARLRHRVVGPVDDERVARRFKRIEEAPGMVKMDQEPSGDGDTGGSISLKRTKTKKDGDTGGARAAKEQKGNVLNELERKLRSQRTLNEAGVVLNRNLSNQILDMQIEVSKLKSNARGLRKDQSDVSAHLKDLVGNLSSAQNLASESLAVLDDADDLPELEVLKTMDKQSRQPAELGSVLPLERPVERPADRSVGQRPARAAAAAKFVKQDTKQVKPPSRVARSLVVSMLQSPGAKAARTAAESDLDAEDASKESRALRRLQAEYDRHTSLLVERHALRAKREALQHLRDKLVSSIEEIKEANIGLVEKVQGVNQFVTNAEDELSHRGRIKALRRSK